MAESIEIPIVLYNIPSASGMQLSAGDIAELTKIDNVRFVEDRSGDAAALTTLVEGYGEHIQTLNGWDTLTFCGNTGERWGAANIFPRAYVRLCESLSVRSNLPEAQRIWTAM